MEAHTYHSPLSPYPLSSDSADEANHHLWKMTMSVVSGLVVNSAASMLRFAAHIDLTWYCAGDTGELGVEADMQRLVQIRSHLFSPPFSIITISQTKCTTADVPHIANRSSSVFGLDCVQRPTVKKVVWRTQRRSRAKKAAHSAST